MIKSKLIKHIHISFSLLLAKFIIQSSKYFGIEMKWICVSVSEQDIGHSQRENGSDTLNFGCDSFGMRIVYKCNNTKCSLNTVFGILGIRTVMVR